jgi:ferredoxin
MFGAKQAMASLPVPESAAIASSARAGTAVAEAGHQSSSNEEETKMATVITEECINCGACEPVCPNRAITAGDDYYVIAEGRCTECVGFFGKEACADACPVNCCVPDPKKPESEADLYARAVALHPKKKLPALEALGAGQSRFRAGAAS